MRPQIALWVGVCCALLVAPLAAQGDLAAERARVLTSIGDTEDLNQPLFPLRANVGNVFTQDITRDGALSLRLRFEVKRPGDAWGIQVHRIEGGGDGEVLWSTWSDAQGNLRPADTFWSDEMDANSVRVQVHSSKPNNELQVLIDRIVVGRDPSVPVSITGANQLASILNQDSRIRRLGESVARLRFVADDGGAFVCTGFLVTPDLMLTNQHCLSTQSEVESALVDFDFDQEGEPGETMRLSSLLAADFELDFALVRLERCVGRAPLTLDTRALAEDQQLMIIQHPAGEPKQVSLQDCTVDGARVSGRMGNPTDFGHQCDTKGGSSGSPVFDFSERTVVGLHHLGFRQGSTQAFNRAVQIGRVLEALDDAERAEINGDDP